MKNNKKPGEAKGNKKGGGLKLRRMNSSLWILLFAILAMFLAQNFFVQKEVEEIPYSRFKQLLQQQRVKEVKVFPQKILGVMTLPDSVAMSTGDGETSESGELFFSTVRVDDPDLVEKLEANGITFEGKAETDWWQGILFWESNTKF